MSHHPATTTAPAVGAPSHGAFRYIDGTLVQEGTLRTAYVSTLLLAPQLKAAA